MLLEWSMTMLTLTSVAAVYWTISYTLLTHPRWITTRLYPVNETSLKRRSKPLQQPAVLLAAHRGGSAERPENSLAAFDYAVQCGCAMLEMDVHLTKDKQVVVVHDNSLQRTCSDSRLIKELDYAELPLMKRHLPLVFRFNHSSRQTHLNWQSSETDPQSLQHAYAMPLLSTVLQRYPSNIVLNVDLKEESEELMIETSRLLDGVDEERRNNIVWGSIYYKMNHSMQLLRPSQPSFFSGRAVVHTYLLYVTGLLPFCKLNHTHFEVPLLTKPIRQAFQASIADRPMFRLAFRFLVFLTRRKSLYQHLKARGVQVAFWVLNTEEEFDEALEFGADIIMTDRPSLLAEWAHKRGLTVPKNGGIEKR